MESKNGYRRLMKIIIKYIESTIRESTYKNSNIDENMIKEIDNE